MHQGVISSFRSRVAENCALLGYYAARSAKFLPTHQALMVVKHDKVVKTGSDECRCFESSVLYSLDLFGVRNPFCCYTTPNDLPTHLEKHGKFIVKSLEV